MTDFGFPLDRFQLDAIASLDQGRSVLVAAPTGSGKTVVAEAAIDLALAAGGRAFYTTPIKALSNQKFVDLALRLGTDRVGLLTGDNSVSPEAPVVVMTTEVLRNMIYAGSSALEDLHVVILDEVHYLQDAYRGPVWEEVMIHLPANVRLVCLSATVSNASELGEWISTIRGPTDTIVETERPVELTSWYLVGDRLAEEDHLIPVLVDGRPNPDGYRFAEDPRAARRQGKFRRRFATPRRLETAIRLGEEDLLPAIYFIFSRNACDDAFAACRDAGLRFTTSDERQRIRAIVEDRTAAISSEDLNLLGYDLWLAGLEAGLAAHHAGMVPAFKEAVERCFVEGLIRVVFATETLALGINMPARSVVIEKLTKYNGESHEFLTAGEFTQLTGRAGRRGIDDEGHALVMWSPFVGFDQIATLAASRSFPLTSSFRATYNMAANLIRRYDRDSAIEILGLSFAQFQADKALVGLQRRLVDERTRRDRLAETSHCERGDIETYASLRARQEKTRRDLPDGKRAIERALSMLRPGDVIALPDNGGNAAVISIAHRAGGTIRIRAVTGEAEVVVATADDFLQPMHPVAFTELPAPYAPTDSVFLNATARQVADVQLNRDARRRTHASTTRSDLDRAISGHPVNACPDSDVHLLALNEQHQLDRAVEQLRSRVAKRQGSVVRRFEAVLDLMTKWDMVESWTLTRAGRLLGSLYHECDLLIAEAMAQGCFDELDEAELAALVSCVTFEERRQDAPRHPRAPSIPVGSRFVKLAAIAERLQGAERSRGLPVTRLPDMGFAATAYRWCAGQDLSDVLDDDMSAGDFVRNIKVLVDLLRQFAIVAPSASTRAVADRAADALVRGVIATSSEVIVPGMDEVDVAGRPNPVGRSSSG